MCKNLRENESQARALRIDEESVKKRVKDGCTFRESGAGVGRTSWGASVGSLKGIRQGKPALPNGVAG